jgi:hypothetical protein
MPSSVMPSTWSAVPRRRGRGARRRLVSAVLAALLASIAVLAMGVGPAAAHLCHETVNPAGNPAVGDNGVPGDPFGGDAVPGGTSTAPGTRGGGPINSDGFYLVEGLLFSDTTAIDFPGPGASWPTTAIKYTEWGRSDIRITSSIGGPNSVVIYHVQAPGDLYAEAPKGSAGAIFCGVPPPVF